MSSCFIVILTLKSCATFILSLFHSQPLRGAVVSSRRLNIFNTLYLLIHLAQHDIIPELLSAFEPFLEHYTAFSHSLKLDMEIESNQLLIVV